MSAEARPSSTNPPQTDKIQAVINEAPPRGGAFSAKKNMIEPNEPTAPISQVTNLAQVDVETVNAEMVRMHQSSASVVHSEDVELNMSAAAQVHAVNVKLHESAAVVVQADEVTVQHGAVVVARAGALLTAAPVWSWREASSLAMPIRVLSQRVKSAVRRSSWSSCFPVT